MKIQNDPYLNTCFGVKKMHYLVGIMAPIYERLHMSELYMMLYRGWRLFEIDVYLHFCSNLLFFLKHDAYASELD